MSYVIRNAGRYESTLAVTGTPVRETEYRTIKLAAEDVARVACLPEVHVVGPYGEADWYVYRDEDAADGDDGSGALAIVVTSDRYRREARTDEEV